MPKKVLIIDDEPEMVELMSFALKKAGFEVSTCDSGRQALAALEAAKPDLLILDMMLPGADGHTLLGEIDAAPAFKSLPVIVVSALETSRVLLGKFPRVAAFLPKPFQIDAFMAAVSGALAGPAPAAQ